MNEQINIISQHRISSIHREKILLLSNAHPQHNMHSGTKGILLFFQMTRTLQSRVVVTLFHLFTTAIYGRNCFDMQH